MTTDDHGPMGGASGHCLTGDHEHCTFTGCTCPHHEGTPHG